MRYGPSGDDAPSRMLDDSVLGFVRFMTLIAVIVTGAYRYAVPQHGVQREDLFKDWGHILTFYLVGLAAMGWWHDVGKWRFYGLLAAALTGTEIIAFALEYFGLR